MVAAVAVVASLVCLLLSTLYYIREVMVSLVPSTMRHAICSSWTSGPRRKPAAATPCSGRGQVSPGARTFV